jgi:Zn-dependent peptidase ImmA (M78 family)/DNA-binding XRE family transcriptional regulator
MIFGERIRQARELSGLTQRDLAEQVGVAQPFIAQIEANKVLPSRPVLEQVAKVTDVLPTFFEQPPFSSKVKIGSPAFRARKSAKAIERERAFAYTDFQLEQIVTMASKLDLPHFEPLHLAEGPAEAAIATREYLGIEQGKPIANLINAVERKGFIVIALPFEIENIDAFCMWTEIDLERPVIVLSADKPGDRLRSTVAHEIGHAVLHKSLLGEYKNMEEEAHSFGAELLLPEHAMREVITPKFNLTQAGRLKLQWGVSMQFLIKRAADLGIISKRHYRYLFQQLTALGWRLREPANLDIPVEKPRTFRKMVEIFYQNDSEQRLASSMHFSKRRTSTLLSEYSLGITPMTLEGTEEYYYSEDGQNLN